MSKSQKGRDYSTLLIWSAALVTVVRYAAAFIASDMGEITGTLSHVINALMGLSGLGMGILDVIGGTYLFDGWRRSMPASGKAWTFRFKMLTAFVVMLMATGVMILVPFTESRVRHTDMVAVLGEGARLTWWALLVNVAPYLLIGGVSIGNQIVSVNLPENFRKVSDGGAEVSGKFPSDWRKVRKLLTPEQVGEMARMSTGDIQYRYGVQEKTARNWRKYAQSEVEVER